MAIEKIKILGAVLELSAKQHCQFSPIFEVNGLGWQCYLAGSSKTAPRILIFPIAIGANYSYEVKNNEIYAPAFFKHNNSIIATVRSCCLLETFSKFHHSWRTLTWIDIIASICVIFSNSWVIMEKEGSLIVSMTSSCSMYYNFWSRAFLLWILNIGLLLLFLVLVLVRL